MGIGIIVIIAICYTPIIYRINKRLNHIERQLDHLTRNHQENDNSFKEVD